MILEKPFSEKKYLEKEILAIKERLSKFDKIYFEFGGHLLADYHACRVLPGYKKQTKLNVLKIFKKDLEIIYCVYSKHLYSENKDYNSNKYYGQLVLDELYTLEKKGFKINSVVITRADENNNDVLNFIAKLKKRKINVYLTKLIKDYPNDLEIIFGKNGFSKEPYVITTKKMVVVIGPCSNSGKMGVCLSQIYHDSENNINSGYAKFETFPVWNLPLNDPVNLAYEASTADVGDCNMIDEYYKKEYNKNVISYNRDLENFKILKKMLSKFPKTNYMQTYRSPTDMGVNKIKDGIIDLDKVHRAAINEVKRRNVKYLKRYKLGLENKETIDRMKSILLKL
jgi:uncharacterized protein (UPF0371 family)